jgi:hypothetical protein
MDTETENCEHLEDKSVAWELKHRFRDKTFMKNKPLEAVMSPRFSGSYEDTRQYISKFERFKFRQESEIHS